MPRRSYVCDNWDAVIAEIAGIGASQVRLSGGEPLLLDELERKVGRVLEHGMSWTITTNGALLTRHRAWMRTVPPAVLWVSLHDEYMSAGNLIERVGLALGCATEVGVNLFAFQLNRNPGLIRMIERAGATQVKVLHLTPIGREVQSARAPDVQLTPDAIEAIKAVGRQLNVRVEQPSVSPRKTGASTCVLQQRPLLSIDADGSVYSCCVVVGNRASAIGSLRSEGLHDIADRTDWGRVKDHLPCIHVLPGIEGGEEGCPLQLVTVPRQPRIIRELRHQGREGRYTDAVRTYLTSGGLWDPGDESTQPTSCEASMQYAIALQHPGFYGLCVEIYESVVREASMASRIGDLAPRDATEITYNATVQLAVLHARLGRLERARDALGTVAAFPIPRDLGLARASLESWVLIARLTIALGECDYEGAERLAEVAQTRPDWNCQLWGQALGAALRARRLGSEGGSPVEWRREADAIRRAIASMCERDLPGAPWLGLYSGAHLKEVDARLAQELLEQSERIAAELGKFFSVAAASEQLSEIELRRGSDTLSERWLRRSIAAYSRSGVLLDREIAKRLWALAKDCIGTVEAERAFLFAGSMLRPQQLSFNRMCEHWAERDGVERWQVFERFVRDWASTRYSGRYHHPPAGFPTADAVFIQGQSATIVQAKHVSRRPRIGRDRVLWFRHVERALRDMIPGVTVQRFVLVISSSRKSGWSDSLWQSADTERLREAIPRESMLCEVVSEPTLQMDVLLSSWLHQRYFSEVPS